MEIFKALPTFIYNAQKLFLRSTSRDIPASYSVLCFESRARLVTSHHYARLLKNDSRLRGEHRWRPSLTYSAATRRTAIDAAVEVNFTYAKRNRCSSSSYCSKGFEGMRLPLDLVGFTYSYLRYPARRISTSPPLRGWLNICLACPATNYEPPLRAKSAAAKSFLTDVE